MLSLVVRHGMILNPLFFLMKSIVCKSSGASIATFRFLPCRSNATMLYFRAIGSGTICNISSGMVSLVRSTNGMPST